MFLARKLLYLFILIPFILYNVYLASSFVSKGEIELTSDIGRDFLLLQELDQKKIVLIGARANTQDVFHGVFWTYLNYPAYVIGHGNPVAIGWFWVILEVVFLLTTFFLLRSVFNAFVSLLAVALLSVNLILRTYNIFGQEATFYFMPFFLFTIHWYIKSKKAYFLMLHFVAVGIFIQLNVGIGSLFAMLSVLVSLFFIIKNKQWKHLLAFIILPGMLLNYIVFEIHHGFHIVRAMLHLGGSSEFLIPLQSWIQNRLNTIFAFQIFINSQSAIVIFLLTMFFTVIEIRRNSKQKVLLLLLAFYYFGYMILNYFNKGVLLVDYVYLLVPLTVIWLCALANGVYKVLFVPLLLIIIYSNFLFAAANLSSIQQSFIGKSPNSWIALKTVAQSIIDEQKGKEFGYYVYSPDSYAYQQRYAMIYAFENAHAQADEYAKTNTTYVIVSPRPADQPFMGEDWWVKNEAKISSSPVEVKHFSGGYSVEKFLLTPDEQKIPHD